jgi:hypothetical protein
MPNAPKKTLSTLKLLQREVYDARTNLNLYLISNGRESDFLELLKEKKGTVLPQVQKFSAVLAGQANMPDAADKKLIAPIQKELYEIESMLNPENYVYVEKIEGEKIEGGRRRYRKKRTKRRTRGKKRTKSRKKRRKKRRKSRRRKRTRKRRRKNLKKQVGGGEFRENMMDIIRGNEHIIRLKTKGFNNRPTNCRGATHVLIAKLRELGVDDKYIGWGEWSGHSVAIVKDGEEIRENIKIDFADPHPDDIGNYYVFDGSFHQILKVGDVKSIENILFTGKLIDYYTDHYSNSWRKDTKLSILPIADHLDWIVLKDYEWILD